MDQLNAKRARGRGRPRDETIDEVAIEAALSLLVEGGVHAVTVDAVARAAGTTRNAIYRRWSSAPDLVWAALERALLSAADRSRMGPPYSIDGLEFEGVLRQVMHRQVQIFADRRFAASYLALAAGALASPAMRLVLDRYRTRINDIMAPPLHPVAAAAGLSGTLVADLITGLVIYRTLMSENALSEDDIKAVGRLVTAGCKQLKEPA